MKSTLKVRPKQLTVYGLQPGDEFETEGGERFRLLYNVSDMRAYVQDLAKTHVVVRDPSTGAITKEFDRPGDKVNISTGTIVARILKGEK